MPTYSISGPDGKMYSIDGPEGATREQIIGKIQERVGSQPQQPAPKLSVGDYVSDFVKSMPRGAVGNIASAPSYAAESPVPPPDALLASTGEKMAALDKNFGLHQPQTRAGRFGEAIGSTAGNPMSYIGPGGAALKIGGAVLSGVGGEAAGQATEGTKYEGAARLGGSIAGGAVASRLLGPRPAQAAIPTIEELKQAAGSDYNAARSMGVELKPSALAGAAENIKAGLESEHGITPITAPKTHATLDLLRSPPEGATVTVDNIRAAQQALGGVAKDARASMLRGGEGGQEFLAASKAQSKIAQLLSSVGPGDIVAGDAKAASNAVGRANANYAAAKRMEGVSGRLNAAEIQTQTTGAGSNLDNKIRQKIAPYAVNKSLQYGWTPQEIEAAKNVAVGSSATNALRKFGKLGFNDGLTMLYHTAAAPLTMGASIPVGIAATASRKAAEAMTKSQANKLSEMLAKRSPLYQSRVNALPQVDLSPNRAALVRALMTAH